MNQKLQTSLLAIAAIATAFTLGKSIVHSEAEYPVTQEYAFPEFVTLSQWQLLNSQPVNPHLVQPPAYISGNFIAGKHYLFRQDKKLLNIEMRYLANTNGDLKSFIASQTAELSSRLRQDQEGGFYSVYTYKDRAYLDACINPRGSSTVTSDQFKRNMMIHDTRIQMIIPWLLGKSEFRDKRCLWAHLSMPLNNDIAVEDTYLSLETAWFDWHDLWQSHYPDP